MTRGDSLATGRLAGSGLEVRVLGPADDTEAVLDLRRRAFGPFTPATRRPWEESLRAGLAGGQFIGVLDGGRLVASARYLPMRQWWLGRSMPMAGVASVMVAPEERGRGVGSAMMARMLAEIAERGYPLSTLYPTTAPLYRSAGWEFAGGKYETVLPARSLAALLPPGPEAAGARPKLRRASPDDAGLIALTKDRVHGELRQCGPFTREPATLRTWLDDEDHFAYLADDGFLSYRWADGHNEIEVEELVAASAATAREFWQILASHGTLARRVRACLAPDDPVEWLARDPAAALRRRNGWMLRIVDAPAAIAGRGYPAAASLSVVLDLTDPALPANSGRWTLEVSGGAASLERAGEPDSARTGAAGALRLGPRGLAAMYAGVALPTLRLAGLVTGGSAADDEALGCAFAGQAFMIDYF